MIPKEIKYNLHYDDGTTTATVESNHPMVQEQTSKISFQVGGCGGHFVFQFHKILATCISTDQPGAVSRVSAQLTERVARC